MATTKKQAQSEPSTEDYPETWLFDEHGETIAGTFLRFEQGQTKKFGPKPIAVLEVDGAERSLWLNATVLVGKFRDELQGRPGRELNIGERVVATRLEEKTAADGETVYRNYRVLFPDRPALKTSDLFTFEDEPDSSRREQRPTFQADEPQEQPAASEEPDDDGSIPF